MRRGRARVRVTCPRTAGAPCRGTLRLTTRGRRPRRLGSRSFAITAGRSATVTIPVDLGRRRRRGDAHRADQRGRERRAADRRVGHAAPVTPTLLAVPNVSEGRDAETIGAIGDAFTSTGARLLDVHSDADHHRSVYTLAGGPGELAPALAEGAREAVERIDLREPRGQHPHVGALDVAPVVFLDDERRGAACAEALLAADLLGEPGLPVYLYGAARRRPHARRAAPRRPRTGCASARPTSARASSSDRTGAVARRRPPAARRVQPRARRRRARSSDARAIAALIREGGEEGLPGVRALGIELDGGEVAQVSTNVEDHRAVPLADAARGGRSATRRSRAAELVGLAPAAAFDGWPDDVPVRNRRTLEDAGSASRSS